MGIIDPIVAPAPTVTDGANRIRNIMIRTTQNMSSELANIRTVVSIFGRANLQTELGADAAAFLAVYHAMKGVLEMPELGIVQDPLP